METAAAPPAAPHNVSPPPAEAPVLTPEQPGDGPRFGLRSVVNGLRRLRNRMGSAAEDTLPQPEPWETAELNPDMLAANTRLLQTPEADVRNPEKPRAKQVFFTPHPDVNRGVIDVVDSRDIGKVEAYVGLDPAAADRTRQHLKDAGHQQDYGRLLFTHKGGGDVIDYAADAFQLGPGVTMLIGTGPYYGYKANEMSAASSTNGLVRIEIDESLAANSKQLTYTLEQSLRSAGLGHLLAHTDEDVDAFKARVAAEYRMVDPSEVTDVSNLVVQQVEGSHVSVLQPGLHEAYEAMADGIQLPNHMAGKAYLADIIKNGGIWSPLERFKRGLGHKGRRTREPETDINFGGGDRVFTYVENVQPKPYPNGEDGDLVSAWSDKVCLLYSSELLDRLDAVGFGQDAYGSAARGVERISPDALFAPKFKSHELDYATQVDNSLLIGVVCDEEDYAGIIQDLSDQGITEVNGRPVESFLRTGLTVKDYRALRAGLQTNADS